MLFGFLLLAFLAVLLELGSYGAWRLIEGSWFSYEQAFELRARLTARPQADTERPVPTVAPEEDLEELATVAKGTIIHPFLGYVYTPDHNQSDDPGMRKYRITDNGFFALRHSAPPSSEEPLRIGVFGGSVAFIFAFKGSSALAPLIEPAVGARGFVVESYALGAYKQPQQLMTLAWLLARGEAPDVVVNLDGFNEVTLPRQKNLPRGINPYYPQNWDARVRDVPDLRMQALSGEVTYLRHRRRELARAFERFGVRRSVTWNFLWRWLDRRASARVGEARQRRAEYRPPDRPYVVRGPTFHGESEAEVVAELVALWERTSLAMHELATGSGLQYFHFLQPNQYVPGSKPLSPSELETAYRARSPFRRPVEQAYPALREAGRRLAADGVEFHDLTSVFADERRTLYVDTCCHFNELGNALIAEVIGETIAAELRDAGRTP